MCVLVLWPDLYSANKIPVLVSFSRRGYQNSAQLYVGETDCDKKKYIYMLFITS